MILEKGWTNTGRLNSRQLTVNSARLSSNSRNFEKQNERNSCRNLVRSPETKKSFFESRKNSFNGFKILL